MKKNLFDEVASLFMFLIVLINTCFLTFVIMRPFKAVSKPLQYKHAQKIIKTPQKQKKQDKTYIVTGTYYNADPAQCGNSHLITADGSEIDTNLLRKGGVRWLAMSRDLLKRWGGPFKYGDTVRVKHENPLLCGLWIVHDCMNRRFNKKIDFLVPFGVSFPGLSKGIKLSK